MLRAETMGREPTYEIPSLPLALFVLFVLVNDDGNPLHGLCVFSLCAV